MKVVNADVPRLWNLMWPALGGPDGTFYFDNQPNMFDQFLANRSMALDDAALRVDANSVEIARFAGMASTGDYPRPVPFGGMGKPVNENGFSDHFPIGLRVLEAP